MQNKYVGDIGDFANNGLLRWLCGITSSDLGRQLKLGVVWYLNENDNREDGKIRDYLKEFQSKFSYCDTELFNALKPTSNEYHKNINFFKRNRAILPGAKFYEEYVHCYRGQARRNEWLQGALNKIGGCELVFINPANGISLANRPRSSAKHAYMYELEAFTQQGEGKSLVIYHHAPRITASEEIFRISQRLQDTLKLPVRSLWYHRGTARFYFVVIHPNHKKVLCTRLESFGRSVWCTIPRFTLVPEPRKVVAAKCKP